MHPREDAPRLQVCLLNYKDNHMCYIPCDLKYHNFIFSICLSFFLINIRGQLSPFSHHHFPPPHPLLPPTGNPTLLWHCSWVLYTCLLMTLSLLSPIISLLPPLQSLSICSLFQCLWLNFACLFVLVIKFWFLFRSYKSFTFHRFAILS